MKKIEFYPGDLIAWVHDESKGTSPENIFYVGLVLSRRKIYWGPRIPRPEQEPWHGSCDSWLLSDYGPGSWLETNLGMPWILFPRPELKGERER